MDRAPRAPVNDDDTAKPAATASHTHAVLRDLQLRSLRIHGSGKQPVVLSHASVLLVHRLAYSSPLMKLVLENTFLQDDRDCDLIAQWQLGDDDSDSDMGV